jgi:alpha-L-fucosidase
MKNSITWAAAAVFLWCADVALAQEKAASSASDQAQARLPEDFLKWKFGLFIHLNLETFVGREWASGYEDPALFNPRKLDCGQWADAAKAAGMKYAMLTTKHTEGYALWNARHANYLLGVPPDNTGRIPDFDVKRLKEIGALLKQMPR